MMTFPVVEKKEEAGTECRAPSFPKGSSDMRLEESIHFYTMYVLASFSLALTST
jgi:hypothetical protein